MTIRSRMLASMLTLATAAPVAANRPNVVFLFSDDQRHDTIHALGNEHVKTPNLDRLVETGFTFTHAFCMGSNSGAVCIPSRAMVMTGKAYFRVDNRLPAGTLLWPEHMRRAGYATFGTGKWHNGAASYARGFTHGANVFFGGMSDHDKVPIHDFDAAGHYPRETRRLGEKFSSELFADAAIEFLRTYRDEKPFFAYVSFTAPHDPRTPPGRHADMYDPAALPLPPNFLPEHPFDNGDMTLRDERLAPWPRTPGIVREHIAAYYGMITHLDAQIGRILDALRSSPHANNTLVVFAGDHGLAVGRHGLLGKQNLYDHSMRPPLIFAGPGIPRGKKSDALCYLFDIFPTICQLSDVDAPVDLDGKSLAGIMAGRQTSVRETVFGAYKNVQRCIRTRHYKLIRYPHINRTQLFDLRADPHEKQDLAADPAHADRVAELTDLLRVHQQQYNDTQPLSTDNPAPMRIRLPPEREP